MNTIERSTKAASALGGKTAKACENCLVKRARWFCTADDAFLCPACDASVHSANQLASKHERFRLETSSYKMIDSHNNVATNCNNPSLPSSSSAAATWHRGFTKKPRTPRQPKSSTSQSPSLLQPTSNVPIDPLVPEINSHEEWPFHQYKDENEEQSVPVFNPSFEDEFDCVKLLGEEGTILGSDDRDLDIGGELFGACDVDFTVDNMLEEEDNSFCGISRVDYNLGLESSAVKVEGGDDEDSDEVQAAIARHFDPQLDMEFDWDFDFNNTNSTTGEEIKFESDILVEATKVPCLDDNNTNSSSYVNNNDHHSHDKYDDMKRSSTMMLKLDYEEVIASWASQDHSPWIDRARPYNFNIDEFMVACTGGAIGVRSGAEREARVSRYREKRRTRLFSKKIRYQVRKLNAQKRPRIKGRFVKRTSLITTTSCMFSGISIPYK